MTKRADEKPSRSATPARAADARRETVTVSVNLACGGQSWRLIALAFVRLVEASETTHDPKVWEQNRPLPDDSYLKTSLSTTAGYGGRGLDTSDGGLRRSPMPSTMAGRISAKPS